MKNLIDSIFNPVIKLMDQMQSKLSSIGTISAKGLDLDNYLGFLTILGPSWSGVISSFLSALSFIGILYLVKTNSRIYLWFKDLIKWW
jgi:hypothetical protein